MSEATMPATEAVVDTTLDERGPESYELAFHVLPTVAEGEVAQVYEKIQSFITKAHGEIFDGEAPERFELAYTIYAHQEGKNRPYNSAYFGWVRFRVVPDAIKKITAEIEHNGSILRYLLIKLTKVEEAHPFRFHAELKSMKKSVTIDEDGEVVEDDSEEAITKNGDEDTVAEVDDAELERALEKPEV